MNQELSSAPELTLPPNGRHRKCDRTPRISELQAEGLEPGIFQVRAWRYRARAVPLSSLGG